LLPRRRKMRLGVATLLLLARALAFHQGRSVVEMRFGKKMVKYRSRLGRLVGKASDKAAIDAIIVRPELKKAGWKMQKRLVQKIRHRAASLGLDMDEVQDRLNLALVDDVEEITVNVVEPAATEEKKPVAAAEKPAAVEEKKPDVVVEKAVVEESLPIAQQVDAEVKAAMKARDQVSVMTLRNIKSALASAAKDAGVEVLADADAVKVLRKLAKMRQESIDMYTKAGDSGAERAAAETAELHVIERWLPTLADEATVRGWIQAILDAGSGPPNKGKIMGALMKEHKDELDGKMATKIAEEMVAAAA